jgi:hypothetical protein
LLDKTLRPDVFQDFSESLSYVEMFNKVCEAKSAFEDLPSEVRSKFRNDPIIRRITVKCTQKKKRIISLRTGHRILFIHNNIRKITSSNIIITRIKRSRKKLTTSTLPVKEKSSPEPDKAPEPQAKAQLPT